MDALFSLLPGWVIVLLVLVLIGLLVSVAIGAFLFLFQVAVVINESRKPPHMDAGDYRLAQGREVRPEHRGATASDDGQRRPSRKQ